MTARGVNALATWMIDHALDEGGEEMSPAGGVASPSEVPTPPSPEMPALIGERYMFICACAVKILFKCVILHAHCDACFFILHRSEEDSPTHIQARDLLDELITESSEMLQSRPIRRYGARRHPPSDIRSFLTLRPSE